MEPTQTTSTLAHDIGKMLESGGLLDPQNPTIEADYPRAARDASLLARQTHNVGLAKMAGWLAILARLSQYRQWLYKEKDIALGMLKTQLVAIGEVVSLGGYDLRNSAARLILAKVIDRLLDEMYTLAPRPGQNRVKPEPTQIEIDGKITEVTRVPIRPIPPVGFPPRPPPPDKVAILVDEAVEEIREIESQAPDLPPPVPASDSDDEDAEEAPLTPPPAAPAAPAAPADKPPTSAPPAQEGRGQLLEAIRKGKALKKAESKSSKSPTAPKAAPTSVAEILASRIAARREAMGEKEESEEEDEDWK